MMRRNGYEIYSGANLRDADLSSTNLVGADLRSADLSYADLRYSNMRGANLSHATLTGANLHGARMPHAIFVGADLSCADLSKKEGPFDKSRFTDADFSDSTFDNAILKGSTFYKAKFNNAKLVNPIFCETQFLWSELHSSTIQISKDSSDLSIIGCDLSQASITPDVIASSINQQFLLRVMFSVVTQISISNLRIRLESNDGDSATVEDSRVVAMRYNPSVGGPYAWLRRHFKASVEGLPGSSFRRCDFSDSVINSVDFRGVSLAGNNFSKTRIYRAKFSGCDLRDANFEGSEFFNVDFKEADLRLANLIDAKFKRCDMRGALLAED